MSECVLSDFVYYIEIDGELDPLLVFESKEAVKEYALENGIGEVDYKIVEWDVE